MRVYSIVINNLTTGACCGQNIKQGTLGLVVDRMPSEPVFEKHGKFLISNENGVWRHYTIGEKGGFGGRDIVLRMKGGKVFKNKGYHKVTFNGNLWDTADGYYKCVELAGGKLMDVSLRTGHTGCFIGGYLLSREEVERKLCHLINFGKPTMNPYIEFGE